MVDEKRRKIIIGGLTAGAAGLGGVGWFLSGNGENGNRDSPTGGSPGNDNDEPEDLEYPLVDADFKEEADVGAYLEADVPVGEERVINTEARWNGEAYPVEWTIDTGENPDEIDVHLGKAAPSVDTLTLPYGSWYGNISMWGLMPAAVNRGMPEEGVVRVGLGFRDLSEIRDDLDDYEVSILEHDADREYQKD